MPDKKVEYPCHKLPEDQWCDNDGRPWGYFTGHTCIPYRAPAEAVRGDYERGLEDAAKVAERFTTDSSVIWTGRTTNTIAIEIRKLSVSPLPPQAAKGE